MEPSELPIRRYADDIARAVRDNAVVVVIGETGSGKTTQISQILLDAGLAGDRMVGVTQPRRVAAVTVARRVAQERGVELGQEVGYAVRFEECASRRTRIKYLTDGTLLRELLRDPELRQYGVLVVDEAHERSLNTDVLFALLKKLAGAGRDPQLKLVITSATLDDAKFAAYYSACPVFQVPGRAFPVQVVHSLDEHAGDYLTAAIDVALDIHVSEPAGDILLFLTGQAEIDRAVRQLNDAVRGLPEGAAGDLLVLPLYAALPPEMQARVFRPGSKGTRRCVVATNIAETSVTVDGVVYVIDPGVAKMKEHNPGTGLDSLKVGPISRVQAVQRAGRAGRTRPGKCFRLYTQRYFDRQMEEVTPPEIQRSSLAGVVLYLKSLPLNIDILRFDYLDPPSRSSLEAALRVLYCLDAIDQDGQITDIGRRMAELPLTPLLARAILAAQDGGCLEDMLVLAGLLSVEGNLFLNGAGPTQLIAGRRRHDGQGASAQSMPLSPEAREALTRAQADGLGDHVLLLRLFRTWERAGATTEAARAAGLDVRALRFARDVRAQLERAVGGAARGAIADRPGSKRRSEWSTGPGNVENDGEADGYSALRQALTVGFASQLAHRMPMHNGYRTLTDKPTLAQVHPSSARLASDEDGLLPEWVVYHELMATAHPFLSKVCAVKLAWVKPLLPRLTNVNVERLSGGATGAAAAAKEAAKEAGVEKEGDAPTQPLLVASGRRNSQADVDSARARYLARKMQRKG